MSDRGTKILEGIEKKMKDSGMDEVRMVYAGENGVNPDTLTTLHRGFGSISNLAEGEFCFVGSKDDEPARFVARIAFASELSSDVIPALTARIAVINAEIAAGAYEYDPVDDELSFALKIPVADGLSDEDLSEMIGSDIAIALSVGEQYAAELLEIANGNGGEF